MVFHSLTLYAPIPQNGCSRRIVLMRSTIWWGLALKGLTTFQSFHSTSWFTEKEGISIA